MKIATIGEHILVNSGSNKLNMNTVVNEVGGGPNDRLRGA
jgi:hypothetical protein